MTVPNLITLLRIVLVPVFAALWWKGDHPGALATFTAAALSDLVDGLLARTLDQRSRVGAVLDPAADKLLVLVAFLVAAAVHAVPRWLAALVIGRDVCLVAGLLALTLAGRPRPAIGPSRLGKYAAFTQMLTIGLALIADAARRPGLAPYVAAFALQAALLTVIAFVQYAFAALRALRSGKVAA
jgi:cardiolipin synthase